MRIALSVAVSAIIAATTLAVAADPSPQKPTKHVERRIEGWNVRVDDRLIEGSNAELGRHALKLLELRLLEIQFAVSSDKLARLRQVPIWLDLTHGDLNSMQYHPSADWLKSHGYDPRLEKCVHIPNAAQFISPNYQRVQPWSVMHELAHAYHDQVLGFDDPAIIAAWKKYKQSGHGEHVLHINGKLTRHYALTDQKEFFAEMTETYLGMNDFFPFNRAELKREEPEIHALLAKIWDGKK